MPNCDIWGTVDFGKGPVEVRCTKTGDHDEHRCEVTLNISHETKKKNIFEK